MLKYFVGIFRFYIIEVVSNFKHYIKRNKTQTGQSENLDPSCIPKYINELLKPPVYMPFIIKSKNGKEEKDNCCKKKEKTHLYFVDISEFKQQILPKGFPKTTVWGYGGLVKDTKTGRIRYSRSAPGATFEAVRNIPVRVKWINKLKCSNRFAVDPTLHWANPNNMSMEPPKPWPTFPQGFPEAQSPVTTVTHLHGGEVSSIYDGHPEAWFTYNGKRGPVFVTSMYSYPNKQEPTTLWYHDHSLGATRLNVYAGLAGFYLLRDSYNRSKKKSELPEGKYEIPIVIQDISFHRDGSFSFYNEGTNPDIHPYWVPEFLGDTIMVNGIVWPNLNVERRQYRFRILNGSNARFYNLKMSNCMTFIQIGTDGGFLSEPVVLDTLLIAPGERADILVDFSDVETGDSIILLNNANTPFPDGEEPDPNTVGQIMKFHIPFCCDESVKPQKLPDKLNNIPILIPDSPQRTLTLNEVMGPNGPEILLLNGQKWEAPVSELPIVGSTEEWVIANLTMDTHPIHLHLVQYQLLDRQYFNAEGYKTDWEKINGLPPFEHPTEVLPVDCYLLGERIEPDDNEKGWKDTVRMNPNQVTRIIVRFAPQNTPCSAVWPGKNMYPFDPTLGPGYVWHCHILDHEDNEMMRPFDVINNGKLN